MFFFPSYRIIIQETENECVRVPYFQANFMKTYYKIKNKIPCILLWITQKLTRKAHTILLVINYSLAYMN